MKSRRPALALLRHQVDRGVEVVVGGVADKVIVLFDVKDKFGVVLPVFVMMLFAERHGDQLQSVEVLGELGGLGFRILPDGIGHHHVPSHHVDPHCASSVSRSRDHDTPRRSPPRAPNPMPAAHRWEPTSGGQASHKDMLIMDLRFTSAGCAAQDPEERLDIRVSPDISIAIKVRAGRARGGRAVPREAGEEGLDV